MEFHYQTKTMNFLSCVQQEGKERRVRESFSTNGALSPWFLKRRRLFETKGNIVIKSVGNQHQKALEP